MFADDGSGIGDIEQQVHSIVSRFNELVKVRDEIEHQSAIRDEGIMLLQQDLGEEIDEIRSSINEIYAKLDEAQRVKESLISELRDIAKVDAVARIEKRIDGREFENNVSRDEFSRLIMRNK